MPNPVVDPGLVGSKQICRDGNRRLFLSKTLGDHIKKHIIGEKLCLSVLFWSKFEYT